MQSVSALAHELFRFLHDEGVRFCVVGDSRNYPEEIASDIDIVVEPKALLTLSARIGRFASAQEVKLVQCLQHEHNAYYFVLAWQATDGRFRYLTPDFCADYYRGGVLFLHAEELLSEAVGAVDASGKPKGFFTAAPAREFIYYLVKRVDKGQLDWPRCEYLHLCWCADPRGAEAQLMRFWNNPAETDLIARAAESNEWQGVCAALPSLRKSMHRRLHTSPRALLREARRRVHRVVHPTGLLVAFVGPDGSGKSSVIEHVSVLLSPAFRRVRTMHLRPRLGAAGARQPETAPHSKTPRGRLSSMAKIVYFVVDYSLGYLCKIRPLLVRSTFVAMDRYYHDLLVDPQRYRYSAGLGLARFSARFIPEPDLWIFLDAPSETLQARKQEVPMAESLRQRDEYLALAAELPNAVVLDAGQPLDSVAAKASAAILEELAHHTAARLRNREFTNPLGARLLLFSCRYNIPVLSRFVRILFNSDIFCRIRFPIHLPHPYGIVIHSKTVIGSGVTVMQQVTLGGKSPEEPDAPVIEDDVRIGAGAKILGRVRVGRGAVIGANAVVTRDVPAYATVVGANRILRASRTTGDQTFRLPRSLARENRDEVRVAQTQTKEALRDG